MSLLPLRPLQQRAIDGLKASLRSGHRRPIIQGPTGFGKTVIGAHIVDGALKKGNSCAFVVPMIGLIDQTLDRLEENGIDENDIGVVQGDHPRHRPDAPIQVCSIQTIAQRGRPKVSFVVADEVHLKFKELEGWIDDEPGKIFVGLSATPWARGLAKHWDDLIVPTSIKELIEQKWLTPIRAFSPSHPEGLADVRISADSGDYIVDELATLMSKATIVGDVVQTWIEMAKGRPTLCFAVDLAHASLLHEKFVSAGVSSAYVDAATDRYDRAAYGRRLNKGLLDVIVSVGTMTHGLDLDVRCISLARPTKSEMLYVQMVGRGLRIADGKEDLLLLDHSDSTLNLGMVTEIGHSKLRGGKGAKGQEYEPRTRKPHECPSCHALIPPGKVQCPECGYQSEKLCRVVAEEGELIAFELAAEQKRRKKKANQDWTPEQKYTFFGQLKGYMEERNAARVLEGKQPFKPGWAACKYRDKFGVWPNGDYASWGRIEDAPPMECGKMVRSWIRSTMTAWANSSNRQERS